MMTRLGGWLINSAIVAFWVIALGGFLWIAQLPVFQTDSRTINFYVWGDVVDEQLIARFEHDTGIRVNLNYYESNEELLVKLKVTEGRGFDLLMPSDYTVHLLSKAGLLKKLDKRRLPFMRAINPIFLHHYYDPENDYSLPFSAAIYGLGINLTSLDGAVPPASWGAIFNPDQMPAQGFIMVNDPREAVTLAAFYLFGKAEELTPDQEAQVTELLVRQKPHVEVYTDFLGGQLLGANACGMAVTPSILACNAQQENPAVRFLIPQEGTFIAIECLVIPVHSTKEDLVYQLINYLYQADTMRTNAERSAFYPVRSDVAFECEAETGARIAHFLSLEGIKKLHFFREDLIPVAQINRIWLAVKAS